MIHPMLLNVKSNALPLPVWASRKAYLSIRSGAAQAARCIQMMENQIRVAIAQRKYTRLLAQLGYQSNECSSGYPRKVHVTPTNSPSVPSIMTRIALLSTLLLSSSIAQANELETLQAIPEKSVTYQWEVAAKEKRLPEGATIEQDEKHGRVLKITSTGSQNPSTELYTIKNPEIQSRAYVLHGYVKYEGMKQHKQIGYLEMWNTFPSGSYFTRALEKSGPMMQLTGSSRWRRFELPFLISEEGFGSPKKLQFNVNFPDLNESETGSVWISDLTLTECRYPSGSLVQSISPLWIGLAIFGVSVLSALILWRFVKRQKQSEELRRMQAMDFGK